MNEDLQVEAKDVVRTISQHANGQGYYLIPKSFYEKMFNLIDALRSENKRLRLKLEKKVWT